MILGWLDINKGREPYAARFVTELMVHERPPWRKKAKSALPTSKDVAHLIAVRHPSVELSGAKLLGSLEEEALGKETVRVMVFTPSIDVSAAAGRLLQVLQARNPPVVVIGDPCNAFETVFKLFVMPAALQGVLQSGQLPELDVRVTHETDRRGRRTGVARLRWQTN